MAAPTYANGMPQRSVRVLISGQKILAVPKETTVREAARLMKKMRVGAAMVVAKEKLIGIFTERDALFRVLAADRDPATTTLGDVMTPQPQTMHPDEPFLRALRVMHEGKFRHLPVVEFGRPLGIVSVRDALDDDLVQLRWDLEQREEMRD